MLSGPSLSRNLQICVGTSLEFTYIPKLQGTRDKDPDDSPRLFALLPVQHRDEHVVLQLMEQRVGEK